MEDIASDADLLEKPLSELTFLSEQLMLRCKNCVKEFENCGNIGDNKPEEDGKAKKRKKGPSFKLGNVPVNVKSFTSALKELEPLDQIIPSDAGLRSNWCLDFK